MSDSDRRLILLGPQPQYQSLRTALDRLDDDAPIATITAGWQETEPDDRSMAAAIGRESNNLRLFERSEQIFAGDPELIQLLRDRQDKLRHLRDIYRDRLDLALLAARKVISREEKLIDIGPEQKSAIEMIRLLDRQYFVRTSQICDEYEAIMQTAERPLVAKHRIEIEKILTSSGAIVISGGHAAIILNRLKIFGILEMESQLPVIAWSGGAMALGDQLVFFHDSPPEGPGNAEVLRAGIGLFNEWLPLPDAKSRLKLKDSVRVSLFARRFNNYKCIVFDDKTILDRIDGEWLLSDEAVRLDNSGKLEPVAA